MFIKLQTKLQQRGDTIVEVLIAIGVVSLILAGAFVTTNRNLLQTRSAQERGNAQKLVESQIEQIKNAAATDSETIFGTTVPASFCISSSGAIVASSHASCAVNAAGQATSAEPIYHLSVTRSGNTFTVQNTWSSVSGGSNNVEMKYRLYAQ